jgi:hypothetical protein
MTHTTRHTPIAHVVNVGNPSLILCYTLFMEVKTEELAELLLYKHQSSFAHGTTPLALLSTPTSIMSRIWDWSSCTT